MKILDCTLRDGGYINDWNFSDQNINKIIKSLENANIDIIECGYLSDKVKNENNTTLYNKIETINKKLSNQNKNMSKVVMINLNDFEIDKLQHKENALFDGIRLAFHKNDLENALKSAEKIVALGYKLYFQPMVTKNYTDLEFLAMIQKINDINIYSFYIVDSFGSMSLSEFHKYLILAHNNLNDSISLGYHAHNNMQLAFSNAISMCQMNIKREIIIDACIYGIGRGAGNLNTELIADYLNKSYEKNYDTLPLLEIIDELLNSMMKKTSWGFTPAQFLSAAFNCHPNYVTYLINKNTNHIVSIKKILEKMPEDKKTSFDSVFTEKLYRDFILESKSLLKGNFTLDMNKKVVLIASGKSVNEYIETLKEKNENKDYILIGLNHNPSIECDYYFFTNQKRYDEFKSEIKLSQIIVTNNIYVEDTLPFVLDFSKYAFVDDKLIVNVALVCMNYLVSLGFKEVEIAGLDGYIVNNNNYNYDETSFVSDSKSLLEQNNIIMNFLTYLQNKIDIKFVTPSLLEKDKKLRILGVIPARYKSSRFEGKPLCLINDIPMIKRTYNQVKKSKLLDEIVVATENIKIEEYCLKENIPVIMTSANCLTGTDRIAEVSQKMNFDLYLNIQGDEPVIDPKSIDEVVDEFKTYTDEYIAYNLYKVIETKDEITSNTIIKTIVNEKDELMYMSRLGVPFNKSDKNVNFKKQVCVYGFTKKALELFSMRNKTLNEVHEDIEILRFLDMGYKVKMKETNVDSIAVDIPEDVKKVEMFLNDNGLV